MHLLIAYRLPYIFTWELGQDEPAGFCDAYRKKSRIIQRILHAVYTLVNRKKSKPREIQ